MAETCFLICPIGKPGSDVRRRSDQWVRHVIMPVAKQHGYEVARADEMPNSGIITNQIIKALFESPLVVADLTGGNPNVFYELALRHACGKPYIQMVHIGQEIPFDLQGVRTIEYDLSDPDHLVTASTTLSRHIRSIKDGHKVDSPVSMVMTESILSQDSNAVSVFLEKFWSLESNIELLQKNMDGLKDGIRDIGSTIDDVQNDVSSMESDLSSIEQKISHDHASSLEKDIFRIQRSIDAIQADVEKIKLKLR
jgi:hypothetical protein